MQTYLEGKVKTFIKSLPNYPSIFQVENLPGPSYPFSAA
jgi:hypothetical protein